VPPRASSVLRGGYGTPGSDATAGNITLTAAQVLAACSCATRMALRARTCCTAALLVAAMTRPAAGDVIRLLVVNGADAAETITFTPVRRQLRRQPDGGIALIGRTHRTHAHQASRTACPGVLWSRGSWLVTVIRLTPISRIRHGLVTFPGGACRASVKLAALSMRFRPADNC